MVQCMDLLEELNARAQGEAKTYITAAAELAMGAVCACMHYSVDLSRECSDETYRYVLKRENELTLAEQKKIYDRIHTSYPI